METLVNEMRGNIFNKFLSKNLSLKKLIKYYKNIDSLTQNNIQTSQSPNNDRKISETHTQNKEEMGK